MTTPRQTRDDMKFFASGGEKQKHGHALIVAFVTGCKAPGLKTNNQGKKMNTGWADQPGIYYRKVIRKDNIEISLDADMIRLLLAIDENKSLYQVAEEVGMDPPTFKQTLSRLRKQGLIEPVKKDAPVLNEHFLGQLQANLSRAIGPMAVILIEDIVAEMELSISEIPIQQAAELINNLSLEIPDEENRIQFKRSMLDILNKNRK